MTSLPVECRELILHHLWDDQQTLARVLVLSHEWMSLALPILFGNPFEGCSPKNHTALCSLLLRSILSLDPCPIHHPLRCDIINLLTAIQCSRPHHHHHELQPTYVPYISYLTSFETQPWDTFVSQVCGKLVCVRAMHQLRVKVFCAVLSGCQTRLHSISLPVDRLASLALFAKHLPALKRLSVKGDWTCFKQCRALKTFIDIHRTQFSAMQIVHWQLPGIQSFRTQSGDLTSPITDQDYLEVLKMLGQPVSVDMSSWQEFSKVCLQLNLATWCRRLTEFRHTFGLPYVANTFLQHCRALEHLTILVRNENDFEWAAQEQQQLQVASNIPPSTSPRTETPVLSSCATPLTPVKLKSATLAVPRYLLARTLRSIAHGLSMYLERWIVKTCSERELRELQAHQGQFDERDMTYVVFDRSWQFPNLQSWHITRATDKLVFGPGAFQSGAFPRLKELSISGGVSCLTTLPAVTIGAVNGVENHHNNNNNVPVVPHFETWNLPNLEQLNLGDGVAHLFEIETLRYSPRLRSIHLCENITRVAQEMARIMPPLPRWEWTLPQLTVLRLSGRPALSFRFTWLYSCPALEHLHVEDMTPVSFCGSAMGHLPIDNISYPSKSANDEQNRSQHSHGNTDTGELSDNHNNKHDNSNTTQSEEWSPITSKISSCYIQINSRKQICALHLREMIHRFCYNVDRLVLKGSMDNREEWGEMDVGSALEIAKGLPNLERLVVNVGYKPTRVGEYGLVRASTETGEAITDKDAKNECWPAHMDLSTFVMEVYGMNIRVGVFRQIQTPCSC